MAEGFDSSRKMQLTTPLGARALVLTEFSGTEEISGLYEFQLSVHAPRRKPVKFRSLLGQDVRVDIELPDSKWAQALTTGKYPELKRRRFCGLVQQITELRSDTHFVYYQLVMQPRFWLWTQKTDCRIFQEQTVAEILKTMLDGLKVDFRLHSNYQHRPYCVQYNESSYDFVTRLMSEEGIFYFFEHQYDSQDNEQQQQGERLVVTDSVVNLPPISSPDAGELRVPQLEFDDVAGGQRSELRIHRWHRSQKIVSNKCTLRDHTFQLPGQSLDTNEEIPHQVTIGDETYTLAPIDHELEAYQYPGQYAKQFDGIGPGGGERPEALKRLFQHNALFAKREIERHATSSITIKAASDCPQLVPGHKFSLLKNNVSSGPYFVRTIRHVARLNSEDRSNQDPTGESKQGVAASEAHDYSNEFTCQAEVQPYQPTSQPNPPRIFGFQTATVVGPEGEEIFGDKFGRIKVQFHWDRIGNNDADSSCWIRVAQVWAGNRWGAFFWPRIGHEVVVAFENGDPDLPLIVGSVYNAKNMPPMALPKHLASAGLKSCTVGGNPLENFSCVVFHDGEEQEYLQLHSETHECLTSETTKLNYANGGKIDFHGGKDNLLSLFGHGSGSGGGPTTTSPAPNVPPDSSPAQDPIEELKAVLKSFERFGSGSGGLFSTSLGDFGGNGAKPAPTDRGMKNLQGGFEMISGASDRIRLGADFEQCWGRDVKMIADVDSVIHSLLNPITWLTGPPWGKGGTLDQVYGQKKSVLFGNALIAHRGKLIKFQRQDIFQANSAASDLTSYGQMVVKVTDSAVLAIAMLVLVLSIGLSIAIKCRMEQKDSEKWQDEIYRYKTWNSLVALQLLELQCFLDKFLAEILKLEEETQSSTTEITWFNATMLRVFTWRYHGITAEQQAQLAQKKVTKTKGGIALVAGLVGVIDGILKVVNVAGGNTKA